MKLKYLYIFLASLFVVTIVFFVFNRDKSSSHFAKKCKVGMSCQFCENGSYAEWDPRVSDGGITYYNDEGTVLAVVGGMKGNGNMVVKKFIDECKEVKK